MSSYPEIIPEGIGSIDLFPFSFNAGKNVKKELTSQLDLVNSRMQKIIEHFVFDDMPVLMLILKVTTEKSDLKKMAKAIDRLADLVEIQQTLNSRLNVLNLVESDPIWFTSTFSDYASEIDKDLSEIIKD
jgi:hypothetical protein